MNPQQHSQHEVWLEHPFTERLLLWIQRRQQTDLPNQLLAQRKLSNLSRIQDLLSELQATKDLETAIRTGSFVKDTTTTNQNE